MSSISSLARDSTKLFKVLIKDIEHHKAVWEQKNNCKPKNLFYNPLRVVLLAVRFISFIIWFFTAWFIMNYIISIGIKDVPHPKPYSKIRKFLVYWHSRICCRGILFICGFHWFDTKISPKATGFITISNHISYFDVVFHVARGHIGYLAKKDLKTNIFLGRFGTAWQTIWVERSEDIKFISKALQKNTLSSNGVASRASPAPASISQQITVLKHLGEKQTRLAPIIQEIIRRYHAPKGDYWPIFIFVEGTTTNSTHLIKFKTGAFQPGLPVNLCKTSFPYKYWDNTSGVAAFPQHFPFMLMQWHNSVRIRIHDAYNPSEEEKANPSLYAENVRKHLAKIEGFKLSPLTVSDKFLYLAKKRWEGKPISKVPGKYLRYGQ